VLTLAIIPASISAIGAIVPASIGAIGAIVAALLGQRNRQTVKHIARSQADMTGHVEDARALAEVAARKTLKIEERLNTINRAVNTAPHGNATMVKNVQGLADKAADTNAIADNNKLQQILDILQGPPTKGSK
jgi:predicted HAD superfamily Cof-like phosphohydrolase